MKDKLKFTHLSNQDLALQIKGVEHRIDKIVTDLKLPLEQDFSEQATHLTQRAILNGILNSEREYLKDLKVELDHRQVQS